MTKRIARLFVVAMLVGCASHQPLVVAPETVDIGYGTMQKDKLTTAVSKVDIDEKEMSGYSNIYDYLRGKIPGVMIIGNGPNAHIQIRGINSINCSTDPLILVDGTVVNDISMLNPNDIKSVSVLKDSSASIYGSRGANGVILITTKR